MNNSNHRLFLESLKALTIVEFNNLTEKSSKPNNELLYKAYRRTNSYKKITRLSQKYALYLPHETNRPGLIPFLLKREITNPSVAAFDQASKYLEAYSNVLHLIETKLTQKEVKYCFEMYSFEYIKD